MRSLTTDEVTAYCVERGIESINGSSLGYSGLGNHLLFLDVPQSFSKIAVLVRSLLVFRGELAFSGGMVWLRSSDIGSPQLTAVGWRIVECIRRGHGELRPLDVIPADLFRADELLDLHAVLLQVVGFGWVAEFVPTMRGYFVRFKDNGQICVVAETEALMHELRESFQYWNPKDFDPMAARIAEAEAGRLSGEIE